MSTSSPPTSRSPSPSAKRTSSKTFIPSPLSMTDMLACPPLQTQTVSWRRGVHSRSKSSSSVSPPPFMQRSYSLPSPSKNSGGPPPSPKWNITTTPATPTYRNSIQPTFASPTGPTFPNLSALNSKRPTLARTATPPPPPRTPPSYLTTDVFPGSYTNASYPPSLTSGPSTPTSSRSRSPSIYSLETIEDSPDAELEAVLEEEDEEKEEDIVGLGIAVPSVRENEKRDKRKRWSVCGAERRIDLDLDTIWED